MIKKQNYQAVTWVDSESPTKDEARSLMEEFSLSPEVAQDLLLPNFKDRIIFGKDYVYVVLHFPAFKHTHHKSGRQEIDFVIGKNFLITNRYENIDAMSRYAKIFEVNSILNKNPNSIGPGELFLAIMKTVYQSLSDELDAISYILNEAEKKIFSGKEREMVFELSKVGREVINFNHIINPQGSILEALKEGSSKILSHDFSFELEEVINEHYKIAKLLENITQVLQELRETNNSLLSTKQNEIMKMLTIFTFLALPFTVITGFFSMSTSYIPFVDKPYFWYWLVGSELLVLVVISIIAKKKRWF